MAQVYFIGAGPGDPELITIKGKKLIDRADIIIYAGSLVNPALMADNKKARLYNSASMTLDQVVEQMVRAVKEGKEVVRLHTGDPSLYGAIREQMHALDKHCITYCVVPGVSSFTAACASLKKEFTLPGVTQTVICTRLQGRTPVPDREKLSLLAAHQAALAIFLSVQMIDEVVKELLVHYPPSTPVAVVQRASWEDEKIITAALQDIAVQVRQNKIEKTAMILVGGFLGDQYERSKLYDPSFSHAYRKKSCE